MSFNKTCKRAFIGLTVLAFLGGGGYLIRHSSTVSKAPAGRTTDREDGLSSVDAIGALASARERKKRDTDVAHYISAATGEVVKLVMNRAVLRGDDGEETVVVISPPATPQTLRSRLKEFSASRGVYPLAYVEGEENTHSGLRLVTGGIRVKIPREDARKLAADHGLEIVAFPEYAPDWVVFRAAEPLDALEKIDGIREASEVDSADVLIGRRPVPMALPNDPLVGNQWHLKRSNGAASGTDMNVENVWKYGQTGGLRGTGIKIGIIDSGVQTNHPDFSGNINTSIDRDFVGNDNDPSPQGDEDHGTAVAGVAASRGNNGLGGVGVAPEATLVAERLITGVFTTDFQNAEALAHQNDVIEIKNNSWGYDGEIYYADPLLKEALKTSVTSGRGGKGTIFTFAAGNSGHFEDSANYSELTSSIYTIAVGAVDSLGRKAYYTEPGANVVISAPSNGFYGSLGITTTDRTSSLGYNSSSGTSGDYTADFSGTSSSCPAVSGAIALMLQKNPNLGWRDVQAILIRSAVKFNPTEPGWLTNAAGLHFNNDYGAGLIDVGAAVNLAAAWSNLAPQTATVITKNNLSADIPNNAPAGRTVQFAVSGANFSVEHATVKLKASHSARGELEISLISPSGTISKLAVARGDKGRDYNNYTFSTVQNWGENSAGIWTLRVADVSSKSNSVGGVLQNAELVVYGAVAPPKNPAPVVNITAPGDGSIFSPGVGFNVNAEATDLDINGNSGTVTKVQLFANNILVGTDTSAPYSFFVSPAIGAVSLVAKATDNAGLVGNSAPVGIVVKNQTPVINSVSLNATGQAFADAELRVSQVEVTEPEMETYTLAYRWQSSTDGENFVDSSHTAAALPLAPTNSGKLWRCKVTASDGNTVSPAHLSPAVNLLDRPLAKLFRPGDTYNYRSGLVLKGNDLELNRQAIIHEISQGPAGSASEWIEILTLKSGSLAGWKLRDASNNTLTFTNNPQWQNVPAGTLIVVYNGNSPKDPKLPGDSSSAASGKIVLAHNNYTYFDSLSAWTSLGDLGDSLFLLNSSTEKVHELSYGNSLSANPNLGSMEAGAAAYFAGVTDPGADVASEWTVTSGAVSRTLGIAPQTESISPGAVFTSGRYEQNFNATPAADGTNFPTGWSSYYYRASTAQYVNVDTMGVYLGAPYSGVYNFDSKIGLRGGTQEFDPGFLVLALDHTSGVTGLKISYDIQKIVEESSDMEISLEYATANPGYPGTVWRSISGASMSTGSTPAGTLTKFRNIPLPSEFSNRSERIYLRWLYRTRNGSVSSAGDAFALDNVIISSDASPNVFLTLTFDKESILETAGTNAATGTIRLSQALSAPLMVNLASSDPSEATVPASVTIPANQLTATFPITAIDDLLSDGPQGVTITLSATNFVDVAGVIFVTDDEPSVIGVTPGLANTIENRTFIERLRDGRLSDPALFSLAPGSALPAGLGLNATTGEISGILSQSVVSGSYPVTIERKNSAGKLVSQSIVLNITTQAESNFVTWLSQFALSDRSAGGDPDLDNLPNLLEYALNSSPAALENPSPVRMERSSTELSIIYPKAKNRSDITLSAEWSTSLKPNSWQTLGITHTVISDEAESQKIKSSIPVSAGEPMKFLRLKVTADSNVP
ncbi:S8 family serine peptidase [Luteolibacter algae]|uniref:S8 family serine peptidase n=1 Tax=Luteolibacter algae TaxID=454151 RepID=A0ABW5D3T7_9BACT